MNRNVRLLALAAISAVLAGPVLAEGVTPGATSPLKPERLDTIGGTQAIAASMTPVVVVVAIDPMKIDQVLLRQGMRTTKVVGMTVVNSAGDTLGTIDDLIVMPNDTVTYAVLSVGGFLGMGAHYVVVPYSSLEAVNKQMRLPNASKESLKALPSYSYPA